VLDSPRTAQRPAHSADTRAYAPAGLGSWAAAERAAPDEGDIAGSARDACTRYSFPSVPKSGERWRLDQIEGDGEQVAGRQAVVEPPFLRDGEDLLLRWQVVVLIGLGAC
jgi:hypothetical protein